MIFVVFAFSEMIMQYQTSANLEKLGSDSSLFEVLDR